MTSFHAKIAACTFCFDGAFSVDFATGIRDADAMLGRLTEYFSQVDEPVILVFWGDHYNPIDSNYDVYTATGYASDSSADPRLHQTTLLMWSNYSDQQVDLGTIAAYDISPVMTKSIGSWEGCRRQSLRMACSLRQGLSDKAGTLGPPPRRQWQAGHP